MKDVNVSEGSKSTDVGIIPEDWKVKNLKYICSEPMQNGVFYKPSKKGSGIKLINVGDLYKNIPIDVNSLELFEANLDEQKRYQVLDGDLFFTRSSVVPSGIAQCNIYKQHRNEVVVFDSHVIRVRPDKNKINSSFLHRYFTSRIARNYLVAHAKTATMTTIDQGVLEKCPVLIPPLPEQKAIARVLSDVDDLIRECDSLLAKKRDIKQGTMQQLLTGKKRLPGFSGEWEEKKLVDISTDIGDGIHSTPKYINSSEFHFINGNNLINGFIQITENTKCVSQDEYYKYKKDLSNNTILISINGTIGNIALFANEKVILGKSAAYININKSVFKKYIFYFLQTHAVKSFFEDELTGTTIRNLSLQSIRNTSIQIPPTLPEQKAIAEILSDMDAEIEAIEQKRDKYKAIKQGMMQELLTGKTRLIEN
ncbi:restriction endonuclease subunit S [Myxosarcina sp. GI1]|uniref:restriction endonuclease subunit S n=1 Tax=Myxosarcina sp. GI1 TaxID=1541065 RepID=UPI000691C6DA|nr:restriction endonuclease subunit S [Myxosarcina sp. GI1]